MDWSSQQANAMTAVGKWIKDPSKTKPQVFKLFGYAGTGKTTLAKKLVEDVSNFRFMAYTGKAAHVLRRKGCHGASTIHQSIYRIDEEAEPGELKFVLNEYGLYGVKLIVVDEVSMVNEEIGNDLLSFNIPILVLGDPAQLPPVSGSGFFTKGKPDVLLTDVHRQAADNPIIHLATMVRKHDMPQPGNYGSSIVSRKLGDEELAMQADQLLVGRNTTRKEFNSRARELKGFDNINFLPVEGDKLICLKNNHQLGFMNGSMWGVNRVSGYSETIENIEKDTPYSLWMGLQSDDDPPATRGVEVLTHYFCDKDPPSHYSPDYIHMDYGYAITVHKSQGSEWENIVIFDESSVFRDSKWLWLYTALTRASDRLHLVTRG